MHSDPFQHTIRAAAVDIDELGHVSNVVYVRWVQEVARAHSEAVGLNHEAYLRLQSVFVVRRLEIEYLAPCYAEETIVLTTWVESWSGASSVRKTRIARSDGVQLADASTLWAYVAMASGRPRRIPPEVVAAFAKKT